MGVLDLAGEANSMSGVFEWVWTVRSGVLLLGAEDGSCCMEWVQLEPE